MHAYLFCDLAKILMNHCESHIKNMSAVKSSLIEKYQKFFVLSLNFYRKKAVIIFLEPRMITSKTRKPTEELSFYFYKEVNIFIQDQQR